MLTKTRLIATVAVSAMLAATPALAQDVAIYKPGAPGSDGTVLTAEQATQLADNKYSPDDARFMRDMIPHHGQAVELANLVEGRTNQPKVVDIAGRIKASQADEISFMKEWLQERGEPVMMDMSAHAGHDMSAHYEMMGMATPAEMAELATLEGTAFDRLFLTLMIEHHRGALRMVEDLLDQPGSASDPVLLEFVNDIVADQESEIEQMNGMLAGLSEDPRASLAAGFRDAESAILNLTLVSSQPKPAGFFDPANPAGLKPEIPADEDEDESPDDSETDQDNTSDSDEENKTQFAERSPLLNFANTDMAFSGDIMVAGNYHGFNIYKLGTEGIPNLTSSVVCPGGQGDISIAGDLLIMSVEQTRGRIDCGLQGVADDVSDERFRGLRIFDISDLTRPRQVGLVQTCRGSHTHSIVSQDDTSIIVYNSGTSSIRDGDELAGCVGNVPGDQRTALFRIDVVEIPIANPAAAKIIDSPTVFADPESGQIAGLWQGGDHGEGTQDTNSTNHCHDITVFPSLNLAAGACSGNGIIFDISDPRAPKRIDEVIDKGFAYWHSATFNNDGTKVLFTDEWGGGGRPRCQASDPMDWGANAFYDIVDGKLEARGQYKIPAPQGDKENCVAHNGSIIPVPGRDIFVQAWYQGGISVIDFTDSTNPFEIAYFDRGPVDEDQLITGGYWSAYWYNGRIYGTEIARGLDVFKLEPSEFLTAEEIAAAEAANMGAVFNPQTQVPVTWPADVAAKAEESRKGG
ncbi:DUF305 domain-containing protein [Altererythrobacter sp. RZ02]|uniref:DUF305 domain-containing protein n=1 Tax=Pontixanthobacter rizhaonensis TaxID=2730337 RepID=A0A848QNX4_9SPHN|nr:DUF305 domain-containing protein [Pontixanthobacter rizhaonensis]NMW32904.1 DUF305 domain-containing protein [Pontixanthobacter rizhaonensis]